MFTVLALLLAATVTVYFLCCGNDATRTFPEKLGEAIWTCPMKTYQDPYYEYVVQYPSFFERVPDSLLDERGASQFRYWDNWVQVELTVQVLPDTAVPQRRDTFVTSGPLYIGDSPMTGYSFHAKYVRHRKLWFVLTLTYPDQCATAVERLIRQIDAWTVWSEL